MTAEPNEKSDTDALIQAVKNGTVDEVRRLLHAGVDPNYSRGGKTPLLCAAEGGFDDIVAALLDANADPNLWIFDGVKPLTAATVYGHDGSARLIRECLVRRRESEVREELDRLAWSIGIQKEETELVLTGTEPVDDDPAALFESFWADPATPLEVPFTTFEGWTRQVVVEDLIPFAQEAVETAFPLFHDLVIPPLKFLRGVPAAGNIERFTSQRIRRFGGDSALPRSRYFTLSEASGNDSGTLIREMLAYAHIARTGALDLIDACDPAAPARLEAVGFKGLDLSGRSTLILVFLPGPNTGLSFFLADVGLPQRHCRVPVPVRLEHKHSDRVVDLRVPDTADWFARTVSRAVLEVRTPAKGTKFVKCFPRRPALDNFGQILPALLTQELGGGALSLVVGTLLRKAGANGLVFPSARNDARLRVKDGTLKTASGWNFVDYRDSSPTMNLIAIDVDRSWPTSVRVGPDKSLKQGMVQDPFATRVSIDYEAFGAHRGSFEVEGINMVHDALREIELSQYRNGEVVIPWWAR